MGNRKIGKKLGVEKISKEIGKRKRQRVRRRHGRNVGLMLV